MMIYLQEVLLQIELTLIATIEVSVGDEHETIKVLLSQ